MKNIVSLALFLFYVGCSVQADPAAPQNNSNTSQDTAFAKTLTTITAQTLSDKVYLLAADSMRGRDTPSPELEQTAEYIANTFRALGLTPGAENNSFIQRYPLTRLAGNDSAPNVIGILEGSDSNVIDEYIVFSAHMDHIGTGRTISGDSIYNGADDNASGTSAIIEIARAMSKHNTRPRRSIVFMLVSGEEKGLWGSKWFGKNPTIPLNSIVADINVDMIGRNWKDTVVVIGKEHSSLGSVVDAVEAANPQLGLAAINDPWPTESFYYRSDHYNFACRGVPILFFFSGIHEDYHRQSDEPDTIDYEKTARIARFIALTGWAVANAIDRPEWNPNAYDKVVKGGCRF